MGYDVTLHTCWERSERDGTRYGSGETLAHAHCSAFTPGRQQRVYGVDFLDLLVFFIPGDEMAQIGDPEIPDQDWEWDARGVWKPDWSFAEGVVKILERKARDSNDEYTLTRLPEWKQLVQQGQKNPEAVVSISF